VYYIPPVAKAMEVEVEEEEGDNCKEEVLKSLARGKLFDRTRNVKERMRRKGPLPRVKGARKSQDIEKPTAGMSFLSSYSCVS